MALTMAAEEILVLEDRNEVEIGERHGDREVEVLSFFVFVIFS